MEIDYFCSRSLTLEPKMHWDLFKSTVIERCLTWDAMLLSAAPCRSEWDRRDICAISATRIDPGPVRSISKAESIKFPSGHSGSLTLARVFTGPDESPDCILMLDVLFKHKPVLVVGVKYPGHLQSPPLVRLRTNISSLTSTTWLVGCGLHIHCSQELTVFNS